MPNHGKGGRPKGAKNKRTIKIEEKIKQLECPFEALERVGLRAEKEGDLSTAARCWSELAGYLRAKPRAPEPDHRRPTGLGLDLETLGRLKDAVLAGDKDVVDALTQARSENALH